MQTLTRCQCHIAWPLRWLSSGSGTCPIRQDPGLPRVVSRLRSVSKNQCKTNHLTSSKFHIVARSSAPNQSSLVNFCVLDTELKFKWPSVSHWLTTYLDPQITRKNPLKLFSSTFSTIGLSSDEPSGSVVGGKDNIDSKAVPGLFNTFLGSRKRVFPT